MPSQEPDRRVVRVEDVTDEDAELIADAEVPAEHTPLDDLLDDQTGEPTDGTPLRQEIPGMAPK